LKNKSKRSFGVGFFGIVVMGLLFMLFYVWLRLQTELVSAEIRDLKIQESHLIMKNEKLKAEVVRLSSFGRIQKIAKEKLHLVFLDPEVIIEITKDLIE